MNIKKISLLIVMALNSVSFGLSEEQLPFYGSYISVQEYIRLDETHDTINQCIKQGDFKEALKLADQAISANPDVGIGYYLKFEVGIAKKDLRIVKSSLDALRDKYFVLQTLYNSLDNELERLKDGKFRAQLKGRFKTFLQERETFLKNRLQYKVNRKGIYRELAFLNNLTGDEEKFLEAMKYILPYDWYFSQKFSEKREDPDDDRFKKLKDEYYFKERNWSGTTEDKLKGLMKIATEMRYWNASLDFSDITDWNDHVAKYIPRVMETADLTQYYEVLAEMIGKVGENHTMLHFPPDITRDYSDCGIRVLYTCGKYLVEQVDKAELREEVKPGDEILSINGVQVKTYIEQNKSRYPFITYYYFRPKSYADHKIAERLLLGQKDSEVIVEFKRPEGEPFHLRLRRDSYTSVGKANTSEKRAYIELEILDSNIYYFNIRRFYGSDIYQDFMALIEDLDTEQAKGVIFDLRKNGGGNSGYGDSIFSHFIDVPLNNYVYSYHPARLPRRESTRSLGFLSLFKGGFPIEPAEEKKFHCPVVILTSPLTGSAAEDFAFCFKHHKRGTCVGLPSGGGTGMGHMLLLPGGGSLRINLNVDISFCWRGIQPDIRVELTRQDLVEGKDSQMEKALEILKQEI